MEASVAEAPAEPVETHDGRAEATRTVDELFKWSTHVHVGAGAHECPHATDGACTNVEHFHGWLRMPNQWQARDIQAKADAARARLKRALKDEESDARVTLEDWLDGWLETDESYHNLLTRQANRAAVALQPEIREELLATDQFEHYAADAEELERQMKLPEADRDPEEYQRLSDHIKLFVESFNKRLLAAHEQEMERLGTLDRDEVINIERRERMKELGDDRWVQIYYQWAYFTCVLKPVKAPNFPVARVFSSPEALKSAPEEVTKALRDAYRALENRTVSRGDVAGNS